MRTEGGRTAERQCAFTTGKCYGEGGAGRCAWWERKRERERERNVLFTLQKRCVYSMYIFFFFFYILGVIVFVWGKTREILRVFWTRLCFLPGFIKKPTHIKCGENIREST